MPSKYVLVWREPNATRLRTYTSATNRPLASPLAHVYPHPTVIINDADALNSWLNAPVDERVVAISASLAKSELGWDPEEVENGSADQD